MGLFLNTSKNKKRQRMIFAFFAIVMAVSLIGATVGGAIFSGTNSAQVPRQDQGGELSISELEKQAEENPNDVNVLSRLGYAYYMNDEMDKAMETYEKALEIEPSNTNARFSYAMACFRTEKYDEAVKQMREELKHNPENHEAHFYLGQFLAIGKNDYESAINELETYIEEADEEREAESIKQAENLVEEFKEEASEN